MNIFVATLPNMNDNSLLNMFSFHLFGSLTVINVKEYRNESVFPNLDSNFRQHRLRLSHKTQELLDIKFWDVVLSHMNASSFEIVDNITRMDHSEVDYDVAPDLYIQSEREFGNMYTSEMGLDLLLVPETLPYSDFTAYLIAITSDAFFGYFFILLTGTISNNLNSLKA